MKKAYTKPLIAMESFQLNAAIAGACKEKDAVEVLNHYQSSCTLLEENGEAFFGSACASEGVDVTVPGWTDEGGFCYHGPIADLSAIYLES